MAKTRAELERRMPRNMGQRAVPLAFVNWYGLQVDKQHNFRIDGEDCILSHASVIVAESSLTCGFSLWY